MKQMKKRLCSLFTAALAVLTAAACPVQAAGGTGNNARSETECSWKVLQDRVIELTYESFDYDAGAEYLLKHDPLAAAKGGCSAVKITLGDKVYVGRDYDFYCTDTPAFIVRNNAGKYRTIGIGNGPVSLPDWSEDFTLPDSVTAIAPYICCDVMSEAGLYCEVNIRPYEEALECVSTNPGAKRMWTSCFLQTMLSNYGSIDEILAHIDDYDWFGMKDMGFEEAFFITDQSGRSIIVEFADNSWHYQESQYNANFYINNDLYARETLGCGEMRLAHELSYLPYVREEEDIFTMMQQGAYGQFYTAECDPAYAYPEYYEVTGYNRLTAETDMEGCLAATAEKIRQFSEYSWEKKVERKCWESTFITAANITDLYLHVHFSEHYGIDFTVAFDN